MQLCAPALTQSSNTPTKRHMEIPQHICQRERAGAPKQHKTQATYSPWCKLNPITDKGQGAMKTWKGALTCYNIYSCDERTQAHSNRSWFSLHWKSSHKAFRVSPFSHQTLLLYTLGLANTRKVLVHCQSKNVLRLEVLKWPMNKQRNKICFFMSKDASVYFLVVGAYVYRTYLTTPVFF